MKPLAVVAVALEFEIERALVIVRDDLGAVAQ